MNMPLNIDFNHVKNSLISFCQIVSEKSCEWMGRGITLLKSGADASLPYLQDKRLAVISLIGMTIILIQAGELLGRLAAKCTPRSLIDEKNVDTIREIVGIGTVAGGVIAFSKYAALPLDRLTVAIISVTTFLFLAYCIDRSKTSVADATL
jgi:hypothetical protein